MTRFPDHIVNKLCPASWQGIDFDNPQDGRFNLIPPVFGHPWKQGYAAQSKAYRQWLKETYWPREER